MREDTEYSDAMILALRAKYQEKQSQSLSTDKEVAIGTKQVPLNRAVLFEGRCSILLPELLDDMDYLDSTIKYRSQNRPCIIKTDGDADATMTFNMLPMASTKGTDNVLIQLQKLRCDMQKVWKQNVFYDMGHITADGFLVAWMDFKAFCLDGNLYSLIFLFPLGEQMVLGNFHCSFPQYDKWKPAVLKLLKTIKTEGGKS